MRARFASLAALVVAACKSVNANGSISLRQLDEASYSIVRSGPCFRMKIAQEDDDGEGNSYFYNGAYRSQHERFVALYKCSDDNCDDSITYALDMGDYLDTMTAYVKNYCGSCSNQCRRRLEDEEEGEEEEDNGNNGGNYNMAVDCSTCPDDCSLMFENENSGGADETEYLDCQESHEENDLQYYSAPACDNGRIDIGMYYDDECTIKTYSELDKGFTYANFRTIEKLSLDCSTGACDDLLDAAVNCNQDEGDNYKLCKAAKKAGRVQTYYKKPWYKKFQFNLVGLIIFLTVVACSFAFLAYTYYVRHKKPKAPLAQLDHEVPEIS